MDDHTRQYLYENRRQYLMPDATMLAGSLLALVGYMLPWFKVKSSYHWFYSGWAYVRQGPGSGWILWTLVWLLLAIVASLWARRSVTFAMAGMVGAVGVAVFTLFLVAASFAKIPEESVKSITEYPLAIGLPVLALGLGMQVAGGCRTIVYIVLDTR
jgi:hypothetical protein